MGFLTRLTSKSALHRLPTGAFTIDADGEVVSSTVPQWVADSQLREIGQHVSAIFKAAAAAHLQFSEMKAQDEAFRLTARAMRGGAVIFLSPKTPQGGSPV